MHPRSQLGTPMFERSWLPIASSVTDASPAAARLQPFALINIHRRHSSPTSLRNELIRERCRRFDRSRTGQVETLQNWATTGAPLGDVDSGNNPAELVFDGFTGDENLVRSTYLISDPEFDIAQGATRRDSRCRSTDYHRIAPLRRSRGELVCRLRSCRNLRAKRDH